MAEDRMAVLDMLRNATADGNVDILREGVRVLAGAIMEAEVSELTGAAKGERAPDRRLTNRNGYRERRWDTRVGTIVKGATSHAAPGRPWRHGHDPPTVSGHRPSRGPVRAVRRQARSSAGPARRSAGAQEANPGSATRTARKPKSRVPAQRHASPGSPAFRHTASSVVASFQPNSSATCGRSSARRPDRSTMIP
jgi:Transposase, Mutator family